MNDQPIPYRVAACALPIPYRVPWFVAGTQVHFDCSQGEPDEEK